MLEFKILCLDNTNFRFRCVLGENSFFDFSYSQLELFSNTSFYSVLCSKIGTPLFDFSGIRIGELVSVRHIKDIDQLWLLVRNGSRGEFYYKAIRS